jgi:hypothetical protein
MKGGESNWRDRERSGGRRRRPGVASRTSDCAERHGRTEHAAPCLRSIQVTLTHSSGTHGENTFFLPISRVLAFSSLGSSAACWLEISFSGSLVVFQSYELTKVPCHGPAVAPKRSLPIESRGRVTRHRKARPLLELLL